jgi:hypothetical protein
VQQSKEEVNNLLDELRIHRANLALYRRQMALLGSAHVTPAVIHGIAEALQNIQRIKQILRGWDVAVDDHYDDNLRIADTEGDEGRSGTVTKDEDRDLLVQMLSSNQKDISNSSISIILPIHESVHIARQPIGCVLIVSSILIVLSAINIGSTEGNWVYVAMSIAFVAIISIIVGLTGGMVAQKILRLSKLSVYYAVWASSVLAAIASVGSIFANSAFYLSVWVIPSLVASITGSIAGAFYGSFQDEDEDTTNDDETEQLLPQWENAEDIFREKFKKRYPIYDWDMHELEVAEFHRMGNKAQMHVIVHHEIFGSEHSYTVKININGNILYSKQVD